jgi:signal transduction histidine kinase/ligand-binding sensor domain-containing protein/DNA-binding response OmpR family regulator
MSHPLRNGWGLLLLLVAAFTSLAVATPLNSYLLALNNNNGLSNSSVNTIFQDSDGLLWIGTWDGLNRYDGYDVKEFMHSNADSTTLSNSVIRQVAEEDKVHLWVTTDYGINRFNKYTGRCTRFFLEHPLHSTYPEKSYYCCINSKKEVFASLITQGLFIYDKARNRFDKLQVGTAQQRLHIKQLLIDDKDILWILTDRNLIMQVCVENRRATVLHKIQLPAHSSPELIYDNDKHLWFSINEELYSINTYDKVPSIDATGIKISDNLQSAMSKDGVLYLGTSKGYYYLSPTNQLVHIDDINASVLSLYHGIQDITWIGTDGKGIYKCFSNSNFITNISAERYLKGNIYPVRAILIDKLGSLWIGSKGGGLSRLNHLGAKGLERFDNFNVGTGRSYNSVLSVAQGLQRLWVGTDGTGLLYFDYAANALKQLDVSAFPAGKNIESVYCILQTDANNLYIGTSGYGLFKITLDERQQVTAVKNYTHIKQDKNSIAGNVIYNLADDGRYLWIATRGGGLSRMDKRNGSFTSYKAVSGTADDHLCCNDIISLLLDSRGNLWIGTTQGISLLDAKDKDKPRFRTLNQNIGLPNYNIHSMQEDANHDIWVSTSQGVSHINHKDYTITSYFHEDGLQNNEFSDGAGFTSPDATALFFGGINGFNIIYPNRIVVKDFVPKITIKEVSVANMPYEFLNNTIHTTHDLNTINLSFSIIDYLDNRQCKLSYKLVSNSSLSNTNSGWIDLGTARNILLNQLSPGSYTLYVRAAGDSHTWSTPQEYTIIIDRPWYSSWWAVSLYIIFIGAVALLVLRNINARRRFKHQLELQRLETDNKENVHKAKLKFFTNIAHEFSNSITLIYGAASQILSDKSADKSLNKQLLTIQSNADRMRSQIQELMEFRKAETGYLSVNLQRVNITEMVEKISGNFNNDLEIQNIRFSTYFSEEEDIEWIVDENMLEKIIFNLLSNALKYTPENGYIELKVAVENDNMVITCSNSGHGINPNQLESIFNRFTILENFEKKLAEGKYSRTGIGLSLCKDLVTLMQGTIEVASSVDEFTTFTITLPRRDESEISTVSKPTDYHPVNFTPTPNLFGDQKPLILVVDDQQEICDMIKDIIGEVYDVITANNGRDALDKLKQAKPALIITDIIMPHMNGIELIDNIKSNETTRYIPIIILSSRSGIENRIQALEIGANTFIDKPFHPEHLKAAINNILLNQQMMKQFSQSASAYKEQYNNASISPEDKQFIDKVIDVLSKNYSNEDYTQDELADDLAISRTQLYRRIKRIADMSPGNYISSYRLSQAEKMLVRTDKTIKEIMISCGFHNKTYFYRVFQSANGCTPKEYRDKNQKA